MDGGGPRDGAVHGDGSGVLVVAAVGATSRDSLYTPSSSTGSCVLLLCARYLAPLRGSF